MSTLPLTMTGVIVGRSSFIGHTESRVLTTGSALSRVLSSGMTGDLIFVALSHRNREVIMDDPRDEFTVWSARSVTVLPVVCSVEHDGGFFETV